MRYVIKINVDNAAFQPEPMFEVSRILSELSEALEDGVTVDKKLYDINGNPVGFACLRPDEIPQ